MKSQLVLGGVVGLVLLLIVLMSLHDWTFSSVVTQATQNAAPMIVSHDVTARSYDKAGELKYKLLAASATEYDHAQRLQLEAPQIEVFNGNDHWSITALRGSMQGQGKRAAQEIVLSDQVTAQLVGKQPVSLFSQEFHYWPQTQRLESPGAVVIRQGPNTTRAGSLQADMANGKLLLSRGVESHYAAPAS
jgi:LPS export ABC transporter protein LptC